VLGFFLVGIAELFGFRGNFNLGTVSLLARRSYSWAAGDEERFSDPSTGDYPLFQFHSSFVMQAFWESNALQSLMIYLPVLNRSDPGLSLVTIILGQHILQPAPEQRSICRSLHQSDAGGRLHRCRCQSMDGASRCQHIRWRGQSLGRGQ